MLGLGMLILCFPQVRLWQGWKLLLLPVLIFVIVEIRIVCYMCARYGRNLPYIIVLGAHVEGTRITDSLARRLECAYTYLTENQETRVIVSGGQGRGEEITEAEAMAVYLTQRGIASNRIISEDRSVNTHENLLFSGRLMEPFPSCVGIVSNNFHMYRACQYAYKLGYRNVSRLPADCHLLLLPNYAVREFFAVIKLWILF